MAGHGACARVISRFTPTSRHGLSASIRTRSLSLSGAAQGRGSVSGGDGGGGSHITTESDYVVVGAGSAGCVLAARLTEDTDTSVTLLEAGLPDRGKVNATRVFHLS